MSGRVALATPDRRLRRNVIFIVIIISTIQRIIQLQQALSVTVQETKYPVLVGSVVYCKIKLPKVAKQKWTLLQVQIGQSCKGCI